MSTLIMWHYRFRENKNEAVEAHIPRHRDSKTKKPRHRETKTVNPRHRDSKTFFQRTKSHDIKIPRLKNHGIEIPRPKSHDIKFLWNSDPYALWYIRQDVVISHGKFRTANGKVQVSDFSYAWKLHFRNIRFCRPALFFQKPWWWAVLSHHVFMEENIA